MLLTASISPENLPEFLKEAAQLRTTLTPSLASEIASLENAPPANWTILKDGSRSKVGSIRLSDDQEVVLKYYHPKNFLKKLNYRLRGSRCRCSWIAGLAFQKIGIPTPSPLFISEQTSTLGLLNAQSLLVTEKATGTALRDLPQNRLEAVAPTLKKTFATFADWHIAHGDLKASNIIVDDQDQISFIDLDATRFRLSGKSWDEARAYDRRRFRKNWQDHPAAAAILDDCID